MRRTSPGFSLALALTVWLTVACGGAEPGFRLDDHGALLRDGQPFLPIFVWCTPSARFEAVRELGANTVHPGDKESIDPIVPYVRKAARMGLAVLNDLDRFTPELARDPAILAWSVAHEPDTTDNPSWRFDASADPSGIYLEGERPQATTFRPNPWLDRARPQLSAGHWLSADERGAGHARYAFTVAQAGRYTLWVREFNKEWANPSAWQVDEMPARETPRTLRAREIVHMGGGCDVGWCRYGEVDLAAGRHALDLRVVPGRTQGSRPETGSNAVFAVDALWLTTTTNAPRGTLDYPPRKSPEAVRGEYERLRALAPGALAWNILTAGFYGPYRRLPQDLYDGYLRATDIASFDHYPVTGWNRPEALPEVGLATRELVRRARVDGRPRPVWAIVEASDQNLPWTPPQTRGPTPEEMRAEVWSALADGATGIGYFMIALKPFQWDNVPPDVKREMQRGNALMTRLAPLIVLGATDAALQVTGDATEDKATDGHAIHAIRKVHGGQSLLMAVNVTRRAVTPRFAWGAPAGGVLQVCEENRQVRLEAGAFGDAFGPLAVHVYTTGLP